MLNACPTRFEYVVYQPRNPEASDYYRCVEDHFEQLETVWLPARRAYKSLQLGEDDRYRSRFGFWRPYVTDVIQRYLASGSQSIQSLRLGEIVGIYILALRALNVKIVAMNFYWHTRAIHTAPPLLKLKLVLINK